MKKRLLKIFVPLECQNCRFNMFEKGVSHFITTKNRTTNHLELRKSIFTLNSTNHSNGADDYVDPVTGHHYKNIEDFNDKLFNLSGNDKASSYFDTVTKIAWWTTLLTILLIPIKNEKSLLQHIQNIGAGISSLFFGASTALEQSESFSSSKKDILTEKKLNEIISGKKLESIISEENKNIPVTKPLKETISNKKAVIVHPKDEDIQEAKWYLKLNPQSPIINARFHTGTLSEKEYRDFLEGALPTNHKKLITQIINAAHKESFKSGLGCLKKDSEVAYRPIKKFTQDELNNIYQEEFKKYYNIYGNNLKTLNEIEDKAAARYLDTPRFTTKAEKPTSSDTNQSFMEAKPEMSPMLINNTLNQDKTAYNN